MSILYSLFDPQFIHQFHIYLGPVPGIELRSSTCKACTVPLSSIPGSYPDVYMREKSSVYLKSWWVLDVIFWGGPLQDSWMTTAHPNILSSSHKAPDYLSDVLILLSEVCCKILFSGSGRCRGRSEFLAPIRVLFPGPDHRHSFRIECAG